AARAICLGAHALDILPRERRWELLVTIYTGWHDPRREPTRTPAASFGVPEKRTKAVRVRANRRAGASVSGALLRDRASDLGQGEQAQRVGIRTMSTDKFFDSATPRVDRERRQTAIHAHVLRKVRDQSLAGRRRSGRWFDAIQEPEPAHCGGHQRRPRRIALG